MARPYGGFVMWKDELVSLGTDVLRAIAEETASCVWQIVVDVLPTGAIVTVHKQEDCVLMVEVRS